MVLEVILPIFVELIITPISEYVVTPMKRHLSYAFRCDSKVKNLEEAVVELKNKKVRLEQSVVQATRNGEEIYENVSSWLNIVRNDIDEADELTQRKEDAKKERCVGVCPNLKTRYQLSKKADKKASVIGKLVRDAEGFDPISFFPPLEQIVEPSVFAREALSSRLQILDQVMDALKDPQLNVIGVYGMGGVGKTTLAKEVLAKAKQEKMFDSVVLVAVSQTPEVKRIQTEIAELLGMKFDVEELPGRASRLYERLRKSKVLIILDDLWDELDLNAIGIPSGDSLKGCKLLLTSRSIDVLRIKMQTQKEFPLGVLGEEEAWTLFQTMAPKSVDVQFRYIATKVAKKCAGLPLLIIIVAKELQNKDLYAWNDMLKKLSVLGDEDIHQKVHKVLESSFNNLPEGEARSLFLLCSLFAQSNIEIQCLLIYCMGLGLFKHTDTVQEGRNRLFTLISKLKAECLLLDGDMDGFVKMHDVVRDAAISIASRSQHAFVGAGQFRLMDRIDQKCTKISLPYCNVSELPGGLVCPEADLFLLFTEDLCLEMADSFFEGIRKLKAVGFTGMRFVSLPSSLSLLANLHALSLHKCRLNDVGVIGELKQLELLSFADSKIEKLPREIEELTQLKQLDLSNCTMLRVIPANVFSKLCLLEELYILRSFDQWDTKGNVSLMELENLSRLSTLEIQIVSPKLIPEGFRFFDGLKLQRFKISICSEWDWDEKYETSKRLKLKLDLGVRLEHGIAMLLRGAEDLYVDEVRGINLDGESFPHLKHLHIESDSDNIRHLVKSKIQASRQVFVILESLYLNDLKSLEMICDGQLATGSFGKLQKLNIRCCPKLKNVLSFSTAKCMYQLQEMELDACDNVEAIVGDRTENDHYHDEVIEFTQLNSLKLGNLSDLRCFCKKEVGKPKIDSLFNEMVSFPNLTSLEVSDCLSLKYIFTSSVVEGLAQLKKLEIQSCELVEEIVLAKKFEEDSIHMIAFPKLDNLNISHLPNLKRFCHGHVIEFPSLKTLYLDSCPAMQKFVSSSSNDNGSDDYFFNEMVSLSNLETVDVSGLDNSRYLWDEKAIVKDSFFKLKSLSIRDCSKLQIIFPSNLYGRFLKLETLVVSHCGGVEEIYGYDGVDSDGENIEEASALCYLDIWGLQSLKHIWSKDSGRAATFKSLQSVFVQGCEDLKYVFPESVACDLVQLQVLDISESSVEMIIAKKFESGLSSFEFPELTILRLANLNELRSLYEGIHTLELPKLKSLEVYGCLEIMKFGSEISYHSEEENGEDSLSHPQYLFSAQKLFMDSLKLKIDNHGFKAIHGTGVFSAEFFSKVKTITVKNIEEESIHFLFGFLKRLRFLEKLAFENGSLEEISSLNDDDEQAAGEQQHYPRLKHLKLQCLSKLKHIIKKGSQLNHVLQYLQTLTIKRCEGLTDIALHSTSFQNLTTLYLYSCNNVTKLVTLSTAKTMEQLMRMKVEYCRAIEEIIADDSRSTEHDVVNFSKLKCLELIELGRINSFCSGNHTIIFPLLDQLTVKHCSEMKNFCGGFLSTPKLRGVLLNNEQQWEGDLNVTISSQLREWVGGRFKEGRLFQNVESLEVVKDAFSTNAILANQLQFLNKLKEIIVRKCDSVQAVFDLEGLSIEDGDGGFQPELEELHLINLPKLSKLCNRPPAGVLDFNKLKVLKIKNCGKLVHVFTWSMVSCLVHLQRIDLRNCEQMEKFIKEEVDDASTVMLRSLQSVVLECLPKFSGFYSGTGVLECPSLEKMSIRECPSIKAFALRLPTEDRKGKRVHYTHFRHKVFPSLIDLASSFPSFQNLRGLEVYNHNQLTYLLTSSVAKSMVQLEKLSVGNCELLMEIIGNGNDGTLDDIVFSKMGTLELSGLQSLQRFSSGGCTFKFPSLEEFYLGRCPNMKIFCAGNIKAPMLSDVKHGDIFKQRCYWKGDINATIQHIYMEMVGFDGLCDVQLTRFPMLKEKWGDHIPFKYFRWLEKLVVDECASLSSAVSPNLLRELAYLGELKVEKCQSVEQVFDLEGLNANEFSINRMYRLERLQLIDLPSLRLVWSKDPQHILSFINLQFLEVQNCGNLTCIFDLSMASRLPGLEHLEVKNCSLVKHIIVKAEEDTMQEYRTIFPSLLSMSLHNLTNLSSFYSATGILECPFLKAIEVVECPKMELFPSTSLNGKSSCMDVEEKEERVSCGELALLGNQIAVPKLEELKINWNSLKHIFSDDNTPDRGEHSVYRTEPEESNCFNQSDSTLRGEHSVRSVMKINISVEAIRYECSPLTPDILSRIKLIELIGCEGEYGILPPNFLQFFPKPEKLSISDALIEEMNLHELIPLTNNNPESLGFFNKLKLSKLPELKHLVHDDHPHVPDYQDLEDLEVVECSSLKILLPPSASFQNLTTLQVSKCDSLMNLMTSSTARSLVQLKKMVVKECKMMQEIIASGRNGGDYEIRFSQLECLELDDLPCLESFCSGNNEFHLLALEEVVVIGCPNMKNFACSVTPKLKKVKTGRHKKYMKKRYEWECEWEWEGDLNNTIQAMHAEQAFESFGKSKDFQIDKGLFLSTKVNGVEKTLQRITD